jgi:hypothetical protein
MESLISTKFDFLPFESILLFFLINLIFHLFKLNTTILPSILDIEKILSLIN